MMNYKPFWNMIHSKRINLFKPSKLISHYFFLLRRLYPNNPSTAVADARAVVAKKPTCVLVPVFVPLILLIELLLSFRCRKSIVKSIIKVAVRYSWTENE